MRVTRVYVYVTPTHRSRHVRGARIITHVPVTSRDTAYSPHVRACSWRSSEFIDSMDSARARERVRAKEERVCVTNERPCHKIHDGR